MDKAARAPKPRGRILIVDRDPMGGDLLANVLIRERGYEADSLPPGRLLQEVGNSEVDLVVIAADLPSEPGAGLELAHQVNRAHPDTPIVILLHTSTHEMVIRAFRAGARGVFSRRQPMSEFLDCVQQVSKGFIWAGRQETNNLRQALQSIPAPNAILGQDVPSLTAREMQVVRLAATGKTNKAIAEELLLSEHTVKNYLFRAFDKLGVSNRVELLFYLTSQGQKAS
jgi:two-component system, NarL family, nitrate/nitrite response regulator NarL